jgi:hypothetical protein
LSKTAHLSKIARWPNIPHSIVRAKDRPAMATDRGMPVVHEKGVPQHPFDSFKPRRL